MNHYFRKNEIKTALFLNKNEKDVFVLVTFFLYYTTIPLHFLKNKNIQCEQNCIKKYAYMCSLLKILIEKKILMKK